MKVKELIEKIKKLPLAKKEDEYWVGVRFIGKGNERKTAQCSEKSWGKAFNVFMDKFSELCEIEIDYFVLNEFSLLMFVYEKD